MLKKFVPLTADASPSKNPHEVRTYCGENCKIITEWNIENCVPRPQSYHNVCPPQNNTIAKILTIEDKLRRLNEKTERTRFQKRPKPFCTIGDDFLACVVPQRTPEELKTHAIMREYYLRTKRDLESRVHHAEYRRNVGKIIQLTDPRGVASEEEEMAVEEEEAEEEEEQLIRPELATPTSCSYQHIYVPTDRILEMTCPTSGWFINETEAPQVQDEGINYSVYNPRELQRQLEEQKLARYDLIEGKTPLDLWTWNIGRQEDDNELDRVKKDAVVLKFDCDDLELKLFKVPKDLKKTFAVVMVFGNDKVEPEPETINRKYFNRPLEMASLFVAYADTFKLNPDFWTADFMDDILKTAEKLVKRSSDLNYKSSDTDFDILTQITERNAVVGIKLHFTGPIKSDPNLYKALTIYFSKYNACILYSKNLYLLIWKHGKNSFYIFDPHGRDSSCIRDFENGKSSLLSISYVEHLIHLIVRCSKAQFLGDFHLYEVFLVNFGKITIPPPDKPLPKTFKRKWAVINSTFALIPAANTGLQQPTTGREQNASMIISLLALLYADVERAPLWNPEVLDELHKFGAAYFKNMSRRLKLKPKEQLNIMDLPQQLMMGAYKATFANRPFLYTGHVGDCKDFGDSQLTLALQTLFTSGQWEAGLLQIDNSVLAVWRDSEMYYIFDPFRRGKVGQVLDPDDYKTKGVACLQLHTNFDSLCRNLYDKAIQMRRGGKLFLHGINIKCIRPLFAAAELPNPYPKLKLEHPEVVRTEEEPPSEGAEIPEIPEKREKKPVKDQLKVSNSIETLPETERIPEFTSADVVYGLLIQIICEIVSEFPEPVVPQGRLYKQAQKVLLRSDRSYLNLLKHKVLHKTDEDNIYTSRASQPEAGMRPLTLEEELRIPSNYKLLPDGTWVVFGQSELPIFQEDTMKLGGLLAGIVTAALSKIYKVSTWNSDLIDYALEAVNAFGDEFLQYESTLAALLNQKLPRLSIGNTTYEFDVRKIVHTNETSTLRQMLLKSLIHHRRLLVICQRFSCVIFKRYNFLYMFIGFACSPVGYRKFGPGPACMLRFIELDALLRRIEFGCDPHGCEITNFVVAAIQIKRDADDLIFLTRKMMPLDEKELYKEERARLQAESRRKGDKLRFLNDQICKENERIEKFLEAKKKRQEERAQKGKKKPRKRSVSASKTDYEGESEFEEEEYVPEYEEEAEEAIKKKHKRGTRLQKEREVDLYPRPVVYGYQMRHKDNLYKIQGTAALVNRQKASVDEIKPCFFTSAVAILFTVMRPLNQWPPSRIDHVINSGAKIASRVSNMTSAYERIIKNIAVDDYKFDIWVKIFEPLGGRNVSVKRKLERALTGRKYLLLQISNTTYAIFHDEYFHLFDPYKSMELAKGKKYGSEEGEEEEKKKSPTHGFVKYCEHNTASWVLFADIESMLKYIDQRAANKDWRIIQELKFHVVDIISFQKADQRERILQLLTDMEISPACEKHQEVTFCAEHHETMAWIDMENCLPVWSRLNRRNTAGRYRGMSITKAKKYDVEIDKRLWSLWGCLSPYAAVFPVSSRGKQFLACNVIACLAANLYRLSFWTPELLDNIVISGDQYHRESLQNITASDYEFSLEDLNTECMLRDIRFSVHLEYVAMGKLYSQVSRKRMNLVDALMYFFTHFQYGVLQCQKRSLAFGLTKGIEESYFMFDCQSRDHPIFPKGQGAAYVLRTTNLQVLAYCIVVTLNVVFYNVPFTLHKVEMLREGAPVSAGGEEESKGSKQ